MPPHDPRRRDVNKQAKPEHNLSPQQQASQSSFDDAGAKDSTQPKRSRHSFPKPKVDKDVVKGGTQVEAGRKPRARSKSARPSTSSERGIRGVQRPSEQRQTTPEADDDEGEGSEKRSTQGTKHQTPPFDEGHLKNIPATGQLRSGLTYPGALQNYLSSPSTSNEPGSILSDGSCFEAGQTEPACETGSALQRGEGAQSRVRWRAGMRLKRTKSISEPHQTLPAPPAEPEKRGDGKRRKERSSAKPRSIPQPHSQVVAELREAAPGNVETQDIQFLPGEPSPTVSRIPRVPVIGLETKAGVGHDSGGRCSRVFLSCAALVILPLMFLIIPPLLSPTFSGMGNRSPLSSAAKICSLNHNVGYHHAWQLKTTELKALVGAVQDALPFERGGVDVVKEDGDPATLLQTSFGITALGRMQHASTTLLEDLTAWQADGRSGEGANTALGTNRPRQSSHRIVQWVQKYCVGIALYWRSWLETGSKTSDSGSILPWQLLKRQIGRIISSHPTTSWAIGTTRALDELGARFDAAASSSLTPAESTLASTPRAISYIASIEQEAHLLTGIARASSRLSGNAASVEAMNRVADASEHVRSWCTSARQELQGWAEGRLWLFLDSQDGKSLYRMLKEDFAGTQEILWKWWSMGGKDQQEMIAWMREVDEAIWLGNGRLQ